MSTNEKPAEQTTEGYAGLSPRSAEINLPWIWNEIDRIDAALTEARYMRTHRVVQLTLARRSLAELGAMLEEETLPNEGCDG